MINKFKKYLPSLIFFSFILSLIVLADLDKKNLIMDIGRAVPWGDKIGHFALFGILALLLNMALRFRQIRIHSRWFHLGSVLVFAFATVEEFSQLAFSARTFDLIDLTFDLLGIGILSSVSFRKLLIRKLRSFIEYLDRKLCIASK